MSKFNEGDFIRAGFGEYVVVCIEEDRSSLTLSKRFSRNENQVKNKFRQLWERVSYNSGWQVVVPFPLQGSKEIL